MNFSIEVIEATGSTHLIALTGVIEVGREADLGVRDLSVSRRHVRLEPSGDVLVVTDLGSRGGTVANGYRIDGPVSCRPGDWLLIGHTYLRVHETAVTPATTSAAITTEMPAAPVAPAAAIAAPGALSAAVGVGVGVAVDSSVAASTVAGSAAPAGTTSDYATLEAAGVVRIRYRRGSPGERAAKGMLGAAKRARRRLQGLGSEPSGVVPTIWLADPFPDPDDPTRLLTEGTIVNAEQNEIWMVVTAEAPPEPPERPLVLLFGAALPAADDLEALLEGYGLWLAKTPSTDEQLQHLDLPPIVMAEGELRAAMALSFVEFLIEREREQGVRALFDRAQPQGLDAAMQEIFGLNSTSLERAWRENVESGGPKVKTAQFLRLSLRYLRPHKWKQAEIFLYMLFALAFNMVFPFVTRALFDTALPSGDFGQVLPLLGGLAIALAISLAAGLRQAYLSAWVSSAVVRDMRAKMFEKLQFLSKHWYHRHQQGDVLTRLFSDVQVVETGLTSTLRDGIFQMLSMVVSTVVMMILNPMLGILVLVAAPLVAVVYKSMSNGARKRGLAVQEDTGALMNVAAENYSAEPVVKLFSLQHREAGRFNQLSDRLFRSERRLSLFGGLFGLSVNSIVTVLRLLVLGIGAWMILDGGFTVGGLVAFLGIMGEVLAPVTILTGIGQQVQAASGSLQRIDEISDEEPEFVDPPEAIDLPPLTQEIRITDVDFSYSAERQVLDSVDAVIPAGQRIAFVGPSGSGKSTMLQLLMRLYDPDGGSISWDGFDLRAARIESLRGQLGVVFQESFLFDSTVRENIKLGNTNATDDEVLAAAQAAEVDEFISVLPRGYDTVVGERGGMLSGGQRQRVAIARALVRNPKVLLLDEATSALDPKTERQITATLNRISMGRTTVAITHRLTSVTDYDLIFVLHDGHIVEQGRHEQLLALGGIYARLWSEQTGQPVAMMGPPKFEPIPALARMPIFNGLPPEAMADIASRLQATALGAGESISDGDGSLVLIAAGRGRALVPAMGGGWSVAAELGGGDVFGLTALLGGGATGSWFQASEQCELLVITDEALAAIDAAYPSVAQARQQGDEGADAVAEGPRPLSGRHLTRMTSSVRAEDLQGALGDLLGAAGERGGAGGAVGVGGAGGVGAAGADIPTPGAPLGDAAGAKSRVFPRGRR